MIEIYKKLKKYNYWENQKVNAGMKRIFYLDKIDKYLDNNLVKVLLGQRRVGKSYIMRQIIGRLLQKKINPKNIFYLNKEIIEFDEINNYKDLQKLIEIYKKELKVKGKIYLFIDEVQEIDGWEKIVNSLSQDYKNKYEVFITGSNSKMLSGELATYLSGRYVTFEICPFSFSEFIENYKLEKNRANYLKYLQTSGLPEISRLADEETVVHYVSSLRDTIILKDIVQRYNIKDAHLLESLFKYMADNISNLFSVNSIVDYLISNKIKTNFETISNYLGYLVEVFVLHEVDRYDIKGKTIMARNKKYYLNDLSFKNYLSSSFDDRLGKNLENAIFLHFKRLGYQIYVGKINEKEIDFVLEKGDEKKYIQVAYSLTDNKVIKREFGNLQDISDSYEKMVITLDDASFGNKDGINHFLAWEL